MAVLHCESFGWSDTTADYTAYKGYTNFVGTPRLTASSAWSGGYYVDINSGGSGFFDYPISVGGGHHIYCGFRIKTNVGWFVIYDGLFEAFGGGGGCLIENAGVVTASGGPNTGDNAWHYIEIDCLIPTGSHTNDGSLSIYVDGVLALSGTANSGPVTSLRMQTNNSAGTTLLQDFYLTDANSPNAGILGDQQIVYRPVSGAGASTLWTPTGAASNHAAVADSPRPDGDTTYVATAGVGNRDLYAVGSLPQATVTSIQAVATRLIARKDNTATRGVKATVRSGSSNHDGTELLLPNSLAYTGVSAIAETDPSTGVAWTLSGANGAQCGQLLSS